MIRRINLIGGPGSGKSVQAAFLYQQLSILGFSIQQAQEYIKEWVFLERKPAGWDQVTLAVEQLKKEEIPLRAGVKLVVTECPIILSAIYGRAYNCSGWRVVEQLVKEFDEAYKPLNIFLDRTDITLSD